MMTTATSASTSQPKRVLSCVLCQQRKVKCDRSFPCGHCTRAGAKCVPSTLTPRRRRRHFAERELLDRIRQYERLLRRHGIVFNGLESAIAEGGPANRAVDVATSSGDSASPPFRHDALSTTRGSSETNMATEVKDFWTVMNQGFGDIDEDDSDVDPTPFISQSSAKQLLEHDHRPNLQLLFAPGGGPVDLSTLHPDPVQSFRLWQTYLENVNPLLKVTHTPDLQSRIVAAIGNLAQIERSLEALMFAVYGMAVLSLDADECESTFGASRKDLLTKFQFGCEQALVNCDLLRTENLEVLTAFFLYLHLVRSEYGPRSTSSLLAIAVRTAERMRLNSEAANCRCNVLEAELRRRLWYAMVMFDARMSELSAHRGRSMLPLWDCAAPANVNDSELRTEMKIPPTPHHGPTEATLAAVRGETVDFIRHADFHLVFMAPELLVLDRSRWQPTDPDADSISTFERHLNEKFLYQCTPENGLQLMSIMSAQYLLARFRVIRFYARISEDPTYGDEGRNGDDAFDATLAMITADTRLMTDPLTKGFRWVIDFLFPFLGYMLLVQMLKRAPDRYDHARAWEVMSDNFEARWLTRPHEHPVLNVFDKFVLRAWREYEELQRARGHEPQMPRLMVRILGARQSAASSGVAMTDAAAPDTTAMPGVSTTDAMPIVGNVNDVLDYSATDLDTIHAGALFDDLNTIWPVYGWMPPDGSADGSMNW